MSDRELDVQVATEVMGWVRGDSIFRGYWAIDHPDGSQELVDERIDEWQPSTDIAAAMQVAEKVDLFVHYQLCKSWNGSKWLITKLHKDLDDAEECWLDTFVSADTAPEAICRASLLSVMGENNE